MMRRTLPGTITIFVPYGVGLAHGCSIEGRLVSQRLKPGNPLHSEIAGG